MAIDLKLIDKLLADYKQPLSLARKRLLKQLTKALERAAAGRDDRASGLRETRPGGTTTASNSRNGRDHQDAEGRVRRDAAGNAAD